MKEKGWDPSITAAFEVSKDVQEALVNFRPVVALETTIYTHGFPYPDNTALALSLERIVRENGATPATIGIVDGVATVGLSPDQILTIAQSAGKPETMKISRKDIPYILGKVRLLCLCHYGRELCIADELVEGNANRGEEGMGRGEKRRGGCWEKWLTWVRVLWARR